MLLVLAGGLGTRLRPLVADRPKALAPAGEVSFLHFLVEQWAAEGVREMVFLLGHEAEMIVSWLKSQESALLSGIHYSVIVESIPLGTGGALANAVTSLKLKGGFFVANADTWVPGAVSALAGSLKPSITVVPVRDTGRFGAIRVDQHGMILDFVEKGVRGGPGLINAGVYYLTPECFADWNGGPYSLETVLFPKLLANPGLKAIIIDAPFIDIGVPDDYRKFAEWILSGRKEEL